MESVVGVDFGATNIRASVVSPNGSCQEIFKVKVPKSRDPKEVTGCVADLCKKASSQNAPAAVGVGIAGWMDGQTGLIHNAPNLGWRDIRFGTMLKDELGGIPVVLTNDLRAIAWGEYLFGSGQGSQVLLVAYLGSGIGSAVIMNGRPITGSHNIACEIGHVRVVPQGGRSCGCGQLGCLEAYAGGHNMERRAREDIAAGVVTSLRKIVGPNLDSLTCGNIERAAESGDRYAQAIWREASGYLGQTLGSLVTYLNPDRLILGGGVWQGSPTLRALTLDRIRACANPTAMSQCDIVDPKLDDRAGIVGAGALAFSSAPAE